MMGSAVQIEAWADDSGSLTRMLGLEAANPTGGAGSHRYKLDPQFSKHQLLSDSKGLVTLSSCQMATHGFLLAWSSSILESVRLVLFVPSVVLKDPMGFNNEVHVQFLRCARQSD